MRNFIIALNLLFILCGCANQVPLEGGPKDTAPPILKKAVPDTFSTHFTGKKIVITFDEYVVVKNPVKEVIVSPPLDEQPTVQATGKSVEIIFTDSLKPNTTYTINFGSSITDNNEGNILKNYSYTFSTGNYLDSLDASVMILDAYTLKPVANAKWLLYSEMNDSTPIKTRPFYVGYSSETGFAKIDHMPGGSYPQFVLIESNNNFLYDAADEMIAFSDTAIIAGDSTVHRMLVFKEKAAKNKLRSAKTLEPGKIYFKFAGDASDVTIRPITDSLPPFSGHYEFGNESKDSLVYWHPVISKDTLFFEYQIPNLPLDTIRIVYRNTSSTSSRKDKGSSVTPGTKLEIKHNLAPKFDFFKPIELEFNRPVPDLDSSCIHLYQGKTEVKFNWKFTDSVQRKIEIIYPFKQGTEYLFSIPDSCFQDIQKHYNDSVKIPFKTSQLKEYVTLTLRTTGVKGTGNLVFQLLDKEDKIVQEKKVTESGGLFLAVFDRVIPSSYRVKIIYDANGNGKWDTGNYLEHLQPEKVSFFPQNIELKPGFDQETDWDVNAPPKKEELPGDKPKGR